MTTVDMPRPAPWYAEHEIPEGHRLEAYPQDDWRLITVPKPCRAGAGYHHPACGRPAVATLSRSYPPGRNWWAYCEQHMYGRWIEGGQVLGWRLVADDGSHQ